MPGRRAAPRTEGRTIRWARLYDLGTALLSFGRLSALHRKTVELAGIAPGEQVLDVGCGPGRLAIVAGIAVGRTGQVYGIDPAPEMVDRARRNAARAGAPARFDVGMIEALPYADDCYDVVVSSLVFHHLPDDLKRRGLAEIRRVLRAGGRLVIVDFAATPGEGVGHLLCVLGLRKGWDHAERLRAMVRDAGLHTVEMGSTGQRGLAFVRGTKPDSATRADCTTRVGR